MPPACRFICSRVPWRLRNPISLQGNIHVVAAGVYGIICCMNVFHTPSHGPIYRRVHVILGRVGVSIGVVSAVFGLTALFTEGALQ